MDRPPEPRWPTCLARLRDDLAGTDGDARQEARGQRWLLLNSVLLRYLRIHAAHLGSASREEFEDIAAEKSLDLLLRAGSGQWNSTGRSEGEIAAYLSTIARNGLLDLFRHPDRRRVTGVESGAELDPPAHDGGAMARSANPEAEVARRDFVRALCDCAAKLAPRSRVIWLFRVFYEMSSKEIASHPEVNLERGHVDVLLQRCRRAIRDCMQRRGFTAGDMPPGTFIELSIVSATC